VADGIYYSEKLIQWLERSLRSAFNQRDLVLTRTPKNAGGGFPVSLPPGHKTVQTDDGWEYEIREILTDNGQPSNFYFGFVATFVMTTQKKYTLQDSSLIVFHDIGELTPLFRAEWDKQAASDASEHAQPHWHFMQRPEHIEGIVRMMSSSPTEFAPEQTKLFAELADCGKFHFAMSTRWDEDNKPLYKRVFESDDFPKWFESLTIYIAGQIAYLVKKAPVTPKEFAPEPGWQGA